MTLVVHNIIIIQEKKIIIDRYTHEQDNRNNS